MSHSPKTVKKELNMVVKGYVIPEYKRLFKNNKCKLFDNWPKMVTALIKKYTYLSQLFDQWDLYDDSIFDASDCRKTLTRARYGINDNIFGRFEVSANPPSIIKWSVRIGANDGNDQCGNNVKIGISSKPHHINKQFEWEHNSKHYSMDASFGFVSDHHASGYYSVMDSDWKGWSGIGSDLYLHLILNLYTKKMVICEHGRDRREQMIQFNNIELEQDIKYRLTASVPSRNSITIVDFQQHFKN